MQDGAPHFLEFEYRMHFWNKEGQDGPIAWSTHFPDLHALHFISGDI